jgi:hypothetical protein
MSWISLEAATTEIVALGVARREVMQGPGMQEEVPFAPTWVMV